MRLDIAASGRIVQVDYDDLDLLPWPCSIYVHRSGPDKRYVMVEWWKGGVRDRCYLHRLLMGQGREPGGKRARGRLEVDHINGDGLDNRRENLRLCFPKGNQQNVSSRVPSNAVAVQSRHRGVTWNPRTGRWRAIVGLDYKNHRLGEYDDEDEAAEACRAFRATHLPFALG